MKIHKFKNKVNNTKLTAKLPHLLFVLAVFMKQFYILPSGYPQIADVLFILSFALLFVDNKIRLNKIDYNFLILLSFIIVINGIYTCIYSDGEYLFSTFYWIYNFFIIVLFRELLDDLTFASSLLRVFKLNILIQLIICISGIGRRYALIRYMGTFNDPNQFGFFILCCFFIIFLLSYYLEERMSLVWHILAIYLIIRSASIGMILALAVFYFILLIKEIASGKDATMKKVILCFSILLLVICVVIFFRTIIVLLNSFAIQQQNYGIQRLVEKIYRIIYSGGIQNTITVFLNDRASLRLLKVPKYYIFGSGEGNSMRFLVATDGIDVGEIHCTMLAVCYYYGIIPYFFFIRWIYRNIHNTASICWPVYIAIILEAFTLANHRQPFFWMLFVAGSFMTREYSNHKQYISRATRRGQEYETSV